MEQKKIKKKMKGWKKALIIFGAIVLFFSIQIPVMLAINNGTFSAGNAEQYYVANTPALEANALTGKTIIFLGSSVTFGSASGGESFVEFMEKRDGIIPVKEAVSGTLLIDEPVYGKQSYITRMKTIDTSIQADAFICQLSTNDATMRKDLGTISEGFDPENFDTLTVAGAIEYIIWYAQGTWNCPVIFYTGSQYDSERYAAMVDLLLQIQEKWGIGVIDLWNDAEMNAVSEEDYKLYMVNGIHPSRASYREWWTPKFEAYLLEFFSE
ncbi:MAG: SGNH/GDSL hydrolase family protein [Lachnospiraceae bacterium]|nr:SGNH/GDSL hydrolase family protein [Lachnospiraceae bacterium]